MTLGKGDPVPPPPGPDEFHVRFACRKAAVGWDEMYKQAAGNLLVAWKEMRTNPCPNMPTSRHHRLKGDLGVRARDGKPLPQWQIEVTGGGRLWYVLDIGKRTVWVQAVHIGHPKKTE